MNSIKQFILIAASVFSAIVQAAPVASSGNLRIEVPELDKNPNIKIELSARKKIRDKQLKLMREYLEVSNLNGYKSNKTSATSFCSTDEDGEVACEGPDEFIIEVFEREWYSFADGAGHVELEREIMTGQSVCSVSIRGAWGSSSTACDDVESLGRMPEIEAFERSIGRVGEVVSGASEFIEVITPVLPNCAKTTHGNPVKTPDLDYKMGYFLAMDAVS